MFRQATEAGELHGVIKGRSFKRRSKRGSVGAKPVAKANRAADSVCRDSFDEVTPTDIKICTDALDKLSDELRRHGKRVIFNLLTDYPEYKQISPKLKTMHDSVLMGAVEIEEFASRIMAGMINILSCLADGDDVRLDKYCQEIAKKHRANSIMGTKHMPDIIVPFCDMLRAEFGPDEYNAAMKMAFTKFFTALGKSFDACDASQK